MKKKFHSGYVAVMGRPNVGKSTLLNQFLGQKVVITSEKPQTTRNRILCAYSDPNCQILFFDTPGMHKPRDEMNQYMVQEARSALEEADLVLLLTEYDPSLEVGPGDRFLLNLLRETGLPFLVVLNKVDLGKREDVEVLGLKWRELLGGELLYPASALHGAGVAPLLEAVKAALPEGPKYFDDSFLTDRSERFVVGELIREKIFQMTRQEVPHSVAVLVEEMKERPGESKLFIAATVFVETESQKGILIGGAAGCSRNRSGGAGGNRNLASLRGLPRSAGEGAAPLAAGPALHRAAGASSFMSQERVVENGIPDSEEESRSAIRGSVHRLCVIGALSAGISPWIYVGLIFLLHRFAGMDEWTGLFVHVHYPIFLLTVASCLLAFPAAWTVQRVLCGQALRKSASTRQAASSLVAVGIVSLTVVHLPAVMGLLYFLVGGPARAAIAVEVVAFLLYLPMQALTLRPILRLMRKEDRQAGLS